MDIQLHSILIALSLVSFALLITLSFYQKTQKTYPGFKRWVLGTLLIAIAYTSLWTYQYLNITWLTYLISRWTFGIAAMLKLDGTISFLGLKRFNKLFYIIPIIFGLSSAAVNLFQLPILIEDITRPFLFITLSILTARLFFKYAPKLKPGLHKFIGTIFLLYGIVQIVYATLAVLNISLNLGILENLLVVYFLFVSMFEVAWGMGYMMVNGQRLENELMASQNELNETINDLKTAMSQVKSLSGLVPICSSCKSIRDDKGYWNQLEAYLLKHSYATFSHGICPDCAKKIYPELVTDDDKKKKS